MSSNIILIIFSLLALINLIAFFYVGNDKKRSVTHSERIPEVNFFVWAVFFGSMGILVGMYYFHHKTKKPDFVFGISALLLEQLTLVWFLFNG